MLGEIPDEVNLSAAKFAKAYNRLSKCYIALGELANSSINLAKSMELEPNNPTNKEIIHEGVSS